MKVKRYLRKVFKGLYRLIFIRAWPIWGTPLMIYLALLAPYLFKYFNADFWNPDFHLRASGLGLQILFVGIVVKDIYAIMDIFDRPSLKQAIKKWWEDFVSIFSRQTYPASYSAGTLRGVGSLSGITEAKRTGLKIEQRVEILEKELQDYMKKSNKKIKTIEVDINKLRNNLNKERQQREHDLKRVNDIVEIISTNGLKWEGAALVWLVAGMLLSIFPSEVGSILNWF